MKKTSFDLNIPVSIFREGKYFVAYTPALDLSTSAKTYDKAKKRFEELVPTFIEELVKKGTFEEYLETLGWQKNTKKKWSPPVIVSQTIEKIKVPLTV